MKDLYENTSDISQIVNKSRHPRADIWNYFICRESDGKGHYSAKCGVSDEIRHHWLVEDLLNLSEPVYTSSRRVTLAERILEKEAALITVQTNNLLDKKNHLTLDKKCY
ncbi:928_t:CDS:2, partial [Racocetra persica]